MGLEAQVEVLMVKEQSDSSTAGAALTGKLAPVGTCM